MKKYFPSHSVSSVKDPECLLVKQSSVLEFMLSNKCTQLLNAVIHSSTEVRRTVLVITPCSALALASYSESNLLPMGNAGLEDEIRESLEHMGNRTQDSIEILRHKIQENLECPHNI